MRVWDFTEPFPTRLWTSLDSQFGYRAVFTLFRISVHRYSAPIIHETLSQHFTASCPYQWVLGPLSDITAILSLDVLRLLSLSPSVLGRGSRRVKLSTSTSGRPTNSKFLCHNGLCRQRGLGCEFRTLVSAVFSAS